MIWNKIDGENKLMSLEDMILTTEESTQLDQLLAEWRQLRQLSPTKAAQIRQNAIATPEALPDDWWIRFGQSMNRVLSSANQIQKQTITTYLIGQGRLMPGRRISAYQHRYLRPTGVS